MAARRVTSGRVLGIAMLAAAGVLVLPLVLHADPAGAPAPAQPLTVPRPDMPAAGARREANRERIVDARIEQLRAGLQLTAAQAPLWPPVADAVRGLVKAHGVRFRQQLEAADNSIDGLKMQGDHMAKVGVAMGRLADATKPLVASLTPDQKSRLPTLIDRMRPRKVLARAFEVPETDSNAGSGRPGATGAAAPGSAGATGASAPPLAQGAMTAAPGKPSGTAGAPSQPEKDPDDDD